MSDTRPDPSVVDVIRDDARTRQSAGRHSPARDRERVFAIGATAAYAILLVMGLLVHEMWRDELQAWMLAADAPTPWSLFGMLRYEGHPVLWYLVLWPVTRWTTDPWALHVVHGAIATATAYVILRHAPFSRGQRVLLVLGFFFSYEWAVVARSYALGALLMVVLLATLRHDRSRPILHGSLLALLANTSAYGAIVAGGLLLGWLALRLMGPARDRGPRLVAGVVIAIAGFGLATWTAAPPSTPGAFQGEPTQDEGVSHAWATASAVSQLAVAYAPIPLERQGVRSTRTVYRPNRRETLALAAAAALGLAGFLALGLASRPAAALVYGSVTAVMMAFAMVVHSGGLRHHGHYLLALIAGVWLWRVLPEDRRWLRKLRLDRVARVSERYLPAVLGVILVLQVVGALVVWREDVRRPYSGAEAIAELIGALDGPSVVAVTRSIHAPGMSARLGQEVFLLDRRIWGIRADFSLPYVAGTRLGLLAGLEAVVGPGESGLVVSEEPLVELPPGWSAEELLATEDAILPRERLRLTRVSRPLRR